MQPLPVPSSRATKAVLKPPGSRRLGDPTASLPQFIMRWTVEEWQSQHSSEFPVVLVTNSVSAVLAAILEEPRAVGLDMVVGPNGGKPVICACTEHAVFAIETSLIASTELRIFLAFLVGAASAAGVPFVAPNPGLVAALAALGQTDLQLLKPVVVPARIAIKKIDMQTISTDPNALALHFATACYLARDGFAASRLNAAKPIPVEAHAHVNIYQQLCGVESQAQKRQRTQPTNFPTVSFSEPVAIQRAEPAVVQAPLSVDPRIETTRMDLVSPVSHGFEFHKFSYSPLQEDQAADLAATGGPDSAELFREDSVGEPVNAAVLAATEQASRVSVLDENGVELSEREIAILGEENARRFLQVFKS